MTPEQMARVSELFGQVLDLPAEERLTFLRQACPDDAAVRQEVEALLLHDQLADPGFLESGGGAGPALTETVAATPGQGVSAANPSPVHKLDIAGYTLTHELSRGGQGVVYQALQKSTKRKVAIKILLEGPYASLSARKRFEREVELIAQLKHPNVIAIFDSGTTADGHLFYVMDYVRGQPLSAYVRQKKPTLEEVLRLFATVCEAVQYAHQKGVIHRDLKPNNILVEADGTPKIMDFGLAKAMAGPVTTVVSLTQEVVGTLPYMSPEQARGNPDEVDTRTDVYALGVILYELLTGHYPYPVVGQIGEVLRHITETPPTPPSRCWTPDSGVLRREAREVRAGDPALLATPAVRRHPKADPASVHVPNRSDGGDREGQIAIDSRGTEILLCTDAPGLPIRRRDARTDAGRWGQRSSMTYILLIALSSAVSFACNGPSHGRHTAYREPPPGGPIKIAIVAMVNSGRSGGKALAESALDQLHHELATCGTFTLYERTQLRRVIIEQDLQLSDLSDVTTAVPLGRLVGVPRILVGSITEAGVNNGAFNLLGIGTFAESTATCEVQARVILVESGRVEFACTGRGSARRSHIAVFGIGGGSSPGALLLNDAMNAAVGELAAELQSAAYLSEVNVKSNSEGDL